MSKLSLYNVKMPAIAIVRLRKGAARIGLSQVDLMKRFADALHAAKGAKFMVIDLTVAKIAKAPAKKAVKAKAKPKKRRARKSKPLVEAVAEVRAVMDAQPVPTEDRHIWPPITGTVPPPPMGELAPPAPVEGSTAVPVEPIVQPIGAVAQTAEVPPPPPALAAD